MSNAPLFLDDETLTDNLEDDQAGKLLKMATQIGNILPDCVSSFLKVVRLVNDLEAVKNTMDRDSVLTEIVWLTGITIRDLQVPRVRLIQNVIEELEKNYEPKK